MDLRDSGAPQTVAFIIAAAVASFFLCAYPGYLNDSALSLLFSPDSLLQPDIGTIALLIFFIALALYLKKGGLVQLADVWL